MTKEYGAFVIAKKTIQACLILFIILSVIFANKAHADILDPGTITDCGELAAPGTYTLGNNIGSGGSCLFVSSSDVIIDGAGFTITGDITSADGLNDTNGTSGIDITISNAIIVGSVISGNGGNGEGGDGQPGNAGSGGSISISKTSLNISGVTITAGSAGTPLNGSADPGASGNVTLTYTDITTNSSTFIYNANDLIINSESYGSWNGIFDPSHLDTSIDNAGECSNIIFPATYTLSQSITGNCNIGRNGVIIDGNGFTINGNITSSAGATTSPGINIEIIDTIVTGTIIAGNGGNQPNSPFIGATGGSVTITDSTVTSVRSGKGGDGGSLPDPGTGGNGGTVTITNSTHGAVTSGNGGVGGTEDGSGGAISITKTSLDLSSLAITAGSVGGSHGTVARSGTVSLTYSSISTNSSTFINNAHNLSINATSYGVWSGIFDLTNVDMTISNISQCSSMTYPGTYTLTQDITGICVLNQNGITINGAGHTINGSVTGQAGININLSHVVVTGDVVSSNGSNDPDRKGGGNITITDSTVEGGVSSGEGYFAQRTYNVGNGGSIVITNSTVANVTSGSGGGSENISGTGGSITISGSSAGMVTSGFGRGTGNGGAISITNSTHSSVTSGKGGNNELGVGSGGSITISGSTLLLDGKSITAGLAGSDEGVATSGNLTLTYTGINTNTSTFFYNVHNLVINGISFGPWDGVFSPSIYYFNSQVAGAGTLGDWASIANWWSNTSFTTPFGNTPSVADQVSVNSSITQITSGAASVNLITFYGTSTNAINITVANGAVFASSSANSGTITGNALFEGNNSTNGGVVTGMVTREFRTNATTTRDFTAESGRNDWIVIARGSVVNISGATYDIDHNVFKTIDGGSFIYAGNPEGQVVPSIVITSPLSTTTPLIKWSPVVNWDNSTACAYSYDNFTTTHVVNCANDGSDISKPLTAGSVTLYLRGTNSHGSSAEKSVAFVYDNTVPIPTSCGSDLLDEATRPYYYLSANTTANCTATVNTELRGTSTPNAIGFTLTGNVIANAIGSANGFNITLKNIAVTGTVSSNGSNGGSTGYNGGTITIATSTTGAITANGGTGQTTGGNGGTITIVNSSGIASSTTITANGGNATVCGFGGSGGNVSLFNSSYGVVSNSAGNNQAVIGTGLCIATPGGGSSGGSGSFVVVGQYSNPMSSEGGQSNNEPAAPESEPDNTRQNAGANGSGVSSSKSSGFITPPADLLQLNIAEESSQNIGTRILNSLGVDKDSAEKVIKVTQKVVNSPTTKAVGITGATVGLFTASVAYIGGMFSTPLMASEFMLIPIRLWGLVLMAFGIKKRVKPWGTVYDSVTKRPVDPAYVTVTDESGKVVAESLTDIDGRYGFLLPNGTYRISVQKTHYEFPSKKLADKTMDEVYTGLYHGEEIVVRAGEVIDKNIPLDPKGFDWNEYAKEEQGLTVFHKKHEKRWRIIGNILFRLGFVVSIAALILSPSTHNIIIVGTYLLVLLFTIFGVKKIKLGSVTEKFTDKPLAYAIFRVLSPDHQTVLRSGVCDDQGRYYCIVPKGNYYMDIEKKNPDGSYTKVFESNLISGDEGIINKSFAV